MTDGTGLVKHRHAAAHAGPRHVRPPRPVQADHGGGPTRASSAARPPQPPFHRIGRRRSASQQSRRPLGPIIALHAILLGLLVLGTCTAMPAGAALLVLEAQGWMIENTIDLPRSGPLDSDLPQTARILSRDGTVLAEIDDIGYGRRTFVPLSEMSRDLINATTATEDRRYYEHRGVDPRGLLRAIGTNAETGSASEGASTIEMQLTRNLFLADERTDQTLSRKVKEALAAVELDKRYSKDDLLEAYLNIVYYGNRTFGAEAAAQGYFGKSARDLTLPEASLLAGLPQSPTKYNPLVNLEAAKARQKEVLAGMVEADLITAQQAYEALATPLKFESAQAVPPRAPHWTNYVRELVRARFGPEELFTGGLQIRTTIDLEIQELAEQIVARGDDVRAKAHANNTAMVVIEPATGEVLAMVGSRDFSDQSIDGQFNVATSVRQPGSSIKPLVYLSGFEHGLGPHTTLLDEPTDFSAPPGQPPYRPENYENKYFGRMTLRDSLGNSLNVPAVKVLKYVGVPAFQDLARRVGITTLDQWDPRWLSLTLGGGEVRLLELTGAYATLARGGNHVPPEALLEVATTRNETLYAAKLGSNGEQVIDPRLAYQLLHVMGDPGARLLTFGQSSPLNLDRPHMVKTGTTDDYRDTWTLGCVPQVCVGVWMGNTNNDPMVKTSSSLTAGKIWTEMMQALIERNGWAPRSWPQPDGVEFHMVPATGGRQGPYEEVFVTGQEALPVLDMNWMQPD